MMHMYLQDMKKKKIVVFSIISIIIILGISIVIKDYEKKNFKIPDGYIEYYESNKSYLDGPDIKFYIYTDKIIVDVMSYFPSDLYSYTKERTVTLYKDLNESEIKNYKNTIENKKGKIILNIREWNRKNI